MTYAVIGGTGLSRICGGQWRDCPEVKTPYGAPSAVLKVADFDAGRIFFLFRHGRGHSIAPHRINYRANLFALKEAGVTKVIAVNTVGGLAENTPPEALVVPDQLIDYTSGRESSFFDGVLQSLDHIDFTQPFSESIRLRLLQAAGEAGIECGDGGVYGCTQGPRLETAAEVRRLQRDGCDLVGMTAMPEAALARELGLEYASLCLVVNWGAGLTDHPISLDEINRLVARGETRINDILNIIFAQQAL